MKWIIFITIMMFSGTVNAADVIVARVNGNGISSNALEVATDSLIRSMSYHRDLSEQKRNEFRQKALKGLIDGELQYQDAVAKGLKLDKQLVKAQLEGLISQFKSKKAYKEALKAAGFTEDEQLAQIEKGVLIQAVIAKMITEPARASEAEMKTSYESNLNLYTEKESVRLRMISSRDEAKATAALENVLAGEEFSEVAASLSEDAYRMKGGDIGYISKGTILPELEREAFKLKNGETSGLIKADGKWFIIKVETKRPERIMSFEESKESIKKDLENKRFAQLMDAWMADLKAKAKIEIFLKAENAVADGQKPAGHP